MMSPGDHLMPRSRSSRLIQRAAIAAVTGTAAAVAAGCGTASTTGTASSIAGRGATTRTVSASRSSAGSPAGTTRPTDGGGACRAAELVLSYLGGQGATGHGELSFGLRNTARRPCHARGYPRVRLLDRAGRPLSIVPVHSTQDFFGHSPLRALTVAPQASISFRLDVSHGSGSPGVCPMAAAISVTLPGDLRALSTAIINGAYACDHAILSPLQPDLAART